MAPRLPGPEDLGRTPDAAGSRPIGNSDLTGIARGAAAWASAGQDLAKGVGKLGEAVGEVGELQSRFEYSQAHSDFLVKETELRSRLANDTDYSTLEQRYRDEIGKIRDKSAEAISSPNQRARFVQNTDVSIASGAQGVQSRAFKLSGDANQAWAIQTNNRLIDTAMAETDPMRRTQYIDAAIANIDGLAAKGYITQTEALSRKQAFVQQYAVADGIVRAQSDPQGVLNELQAAPGSGAAITNRFLQVEGYGKNSKSSAEGYGQFIDSTWLDVIKRNRPDIAKGRSDDELLALRNDKTLAREMVDAYRNENVAYLQKRGIEPTAGNQYLAHFLGPAGAAAVIKANPNVPAIDALEKAVGEKKAQQMVDANPTILNSLAGNVRAWADKKMGGSGAHEPVYSLLPPAVRAQLAQHAQAELDRQNATDASQFKTRVEDTLAEAQKTGSATQPVTQGEFIRALGANKGLDAYSDYQADMKLRSDISQVARLTPDQQDALIKTYDPKPGEEGYAAAAKRQLALQKVVDEARKARDAGFADRVKDSLGEAVKTGAVTAPIDKQEFIDALGRDAGLRAWQNYDAELKAQRDVRNIPSSPADQNQLLSSYEPVPGGPDYVAAAKRQEEIAKAVARARKERDEDPAAYAIARIPAVSDAWSNFAGVLAKPDAPLAAKQAAARDFVNKTIAEQQRAGVAPTDVQILPKAYVESLQGRLESPQEAGGTSGVVQQIKNEALLWGSAWPQVYRQMAGKVGPLPRVIGSMTDEAGNLVNETTARKLLELNSQKLGDILKDEDVAKSNQVRKDVLTAFQPLLKSMQGHEGQIGVFNDFRGQAEKLAAFYIVNGQDSAAAAARAFKELVGDRYEFRDSWRMPKGLAQSADDIQRGTVQAMADLEAIGIMPPRDNVTGLDSRRAATLAPLQNAAGLTEKGNIDLFNRPQVKNADGSISTVRSMSVGMDGSEVLIPTVSDDGRILSDDQAIEQYRKTGRHLGKFDTPANATAYAEKLHQQQEAYYKQEGLSADYLVKAKANAIRRDGKWITAPDESGLVLVYNDEAVRGTNGKPLVLSWSQLGAIAERAQREYRQTLDFLGAGAGGL